MSETLAQTWWEKSKRRHPQLRDGYAAVLATKGDISAAFVPDRAPVVCVDEGLEGRFRLAGVGALLKREQTREILSRMRRAGAVSVKSHIVCGAAEEAYPQDPDLYSRRIAMRGAADAGLIYEGHIPRLNRPYGLHPAQGTVLDLTGRYASAKVEGGLPLTFAVNGAYVGTDVALDEVELTTQIALGPNGFGNLFTERDPFRIIAIMDPHKDNFDPNDLQRLVAPHRGRVVVDIFTPSKAQLAKAER